ncbi:bestrophin family protein [Pedobacter sp.]|uniref:bestrophin family protein n=1 Tax=Pedobacter sp. TaxID=1411316 RepID=UPI003D7F8BF3
MINYNPKEWFVFVFHLHKADTFRKLWPIMIGVAALSLIVAYLGLNFIDLSQTPFAKNIGMMHSLLGFVISMLLVFRTNTSYDRWWEGRKLLGALVNVSRTFSMKIKALGLTEEDNAFFNRAIPQYAACLKDHLREKRIYDKDSVLIEVREDVHIPNQIALKLVQKVYALEREGKMSAQQLVLLNEDLNQFTNVCGGCERIRNTPIPFSYSTFIKKFVFFYVATLPFGLVLSLGYYMVPIIPFILYVLASLELIAEEIENPFGYDANDLPLDDICTNIKTHVSEILG